MATHRKTFDVPPSALKARDALALDLGTVKNLARVRLNGDDLGIVWCAPWPVNGTRPTRR